MTTVLGIKLTADGSQLVNEVNTSAGALDRLGKSASGAGSEAARLSRESVALSNSFSGLKTMMAGIGFAALARESITLADGYTKLTSQLKNATNSSSEYARAMADVNRISAGAQADIAATSQLYVKLNLALSQNGVTQAQVAKITETVSLGLKINGASSAESASAMLQLSQAFGSGVLRGEEFNAMAEAAPNLLRALAASMGVPYGELHNLASQGAITSEMLTAAFSDPALLASYQGQAKSMQTISGAMTVLSNNVMQTVGALMQQSGAVTGVSNVITGLSDGVSLLSKNMWLVTAGAQGLTAAVGMFVAARASVAIYEYVAATLAAKNAAVAAAEAAVLQARANYMAGGAGVAAAQSALSQAAANATLTGSLIAAKNAMMAFIVSNPILAVTAALAIGVTAWIAWGNSAKDNADKAISAAKGSAAAMKETGIAQLEVINADLKRKSAMLEVTAKGGGFGRGAALEEMRLIQAEMASNNHAIFQLQKDAEKAKTAHDLVTTDAWKKLAMTEKQQHEAKIDELNKTYAAQLKIQGITQEQKLKLTEEYNVKLSVINAKDAKKTPADKAADSELKRYADLTQAANDRIAAFSAESVAMEKQTEAEKQLAVFEQQMIDGKTALIGKHIESTRAKLQEVVAAEQEKNAILAERKAREDAIKSMDSDTASIKKQTDAAIYETSIIGMTKEQITLMKASRDDHTLSIEIERLATLDATGVCDAESEALRQNIAQRKAYKSAMSDQAARQAVQVSIDLEKKANVDMWHAIESTAHSTWTNVFQGGQDAFTKIGATLKASVLDMLYQIIAKPWIVDISASVTGSGGGSGIAGSSGGGLGGVIQAGQTMWSAFSGGMASGIGGMASSFGSMVGSSAISSFGAGMSGSSLAAGLAGPTTAGASGAMGLGATVATAMPYIAAAIAAYTVISGLTAGGGGNNYHRGGTNAQFDANGVMTGSVGQVVGYGPGSVSQSAESTNAVVKMQQNYASIMGLIGAATAATSFGYNTAYADSVGVRGGISSGVNGKAVYVNSNMPEAELQLAASRAVFAAVQNSQLPAYLGHAFDGLTAGSVTLDQINNAYAFAQGLKLLHDQLSETRTPLEVARASMTGLAATLRTSATTYQQDMLAAINSGVNAATLAQWQNFGVVIQNVTQLEAVKVQAEQQAAQAAQAYIKTLQDKAIADYTAARNNTESLRAFAVSVRELQKSLWTGAQSPMASQYAYSRNQFDAVNSAAAAHDAVAQNNLSGAAQAFLAASKSQSASAEAYARDFAYVQNALSNTALVTDQAVTVADKQLEQLKQVNTWLAAIDQKNLTQNQSLTYLLQASIASSEAARMAAVAQAMVDASLSIEKAVTAYGGTFNKANLVTQQNAATGAATLSYADGYRTTSASVTSTAGMSGASVAIDQVAKAQTDAAAAASAARVQARTNALAALNSAKSSAYVEPLMIGPWFTAGVRSVPVAARFSQQVSGLKAIDDAIAASNLRIATAQAAYDALPAFASGGMHLGGARLVGERGPEIEVTGPSRIFNADQTKSMLAGGNNAELLVELRALREEVARLRAENMAGQNAIAGNTQDASKLLKRWEGGGLPASRVLAA